MSLTVSHTKTILNVLQYRKKKNAVYYLCDFPAMYTDMVMYQFIVIIIIITTTTLMQDIYNYMPETNHVSRVGYMVLQLSCSYNFWHLNYYFIVIIIIVI